MKKAKLFSVIFFLFQVIHCNAQKEEAQLEYQNDNLIKELGIGLVQLVNPNEKIILYSYSSCKTIKTNQAKIGKDIIPILNKPDYSIQFFICSEKNNKYFKIVTSIGKYAYIKPTQKYLYYDWYDFLKNQVTSIENKNISFNPLFDKMNGKVITIKNIQSDDEIEVIEIKGDWLNVKNTTLNKEYWIKWREKNNLLVYLNLLM
ncbi:hypothetical protein [Flavobacterium sp. 5]|uniref:hypothetical protein n=1 Tax=Flavobacterium sp. 5 TaxID=2035199 RepID=UPI000C2BDAC9|nr:hypothetical protein [Flavobacterium sp. 5]PKB18728.1 hypothetical protein CLU82_4021 [Flavobacterium sp. 5]